MGEKKFVGCGPCGNLADRFQLRGSEAPAVHSPFGMLPPELGESPHSRAVADVALLSRPGSFRLDFGAKALRLADALDFKCDGIH